MDWSLLDAYDPFACGPYPAYDDKTQLTDEYLSTLLPPQAQPMAPPSNLTLMMAPMQITREIYTLNPNPRPRAMPLREQIMVQHRGDNPREIRNKAEKQRRDKLNQSIAELAAMVPPVVSSNKKIDKTGVLRLTAHYLRAHQYVFGDAIDNSQPSNNFHSEAIKGLLSMLNGFLMSVTYRGLIVVVSQNVNQYIGHSEADLLGQSIFAITHRDDHILLREQLMPRRNLLGPNGELLVPEEIDGTEKVSEALVNDKRRFMIRVKKLTQRSEPAKYVTCHVEGSFRRADRACGVSSRCCPVVRRARARGDNPCSSGNDIVFIGIIRPTTETFMSESALEAFRMEYRTRHSVDGEIIQCEQRIALVTGYMTHEVNGVNAMNFMHRDDVRWVIIALREMYDQRRLFGESCYRLMTKNGQLIYLRTRGRLDIEKGSKMVTTFVCTNTVVDEEEGKHLIKMMKKKFMILINNNEETPTLEEEPAVAESDENETLPVEDPRQLEKVILHLVTNLPSPAPQLDANSPVPEDMQIAIVPPRKERIVSAIEKMYGVIKTFKRLSDKRLPRIPECPITSTARLSPLDEEVSPTSIQDYFMCRDMESDNPNGNYIEPNRASSSSIISPHLGGSSGERFDRSLPSCSGLTGTKRPNERNMDYIHAIKRTTDKSRDIMDDVLETIEEIPEIDDFIDDTIHIIDDTAETVDAALEVVDNTIETFDTSSNSTFDTVYEPNYISEQPRVDKCINYLELAINPTFPNLLHDDVQEVLRELGDDENELNREQDGNF